MFWQFKGFITTSNNQSSVYETVHNLSYAHLIMREGENT